MRTRVIWIVFLVALAFVAGFLYRRSIRPAEVRYRAVKREAVKPPETVKAKAPSYPKRFPAPRVAIVMDDFGYNVNNIDELFAIEEHITLSILPELPYSTEIAKLADARGFEVILHLPLESHRKDVREEMDTIRTGMDDKEVSARLDKDIDSIPGLKGVSNHMGSKSTEERKLMALIFKRLKKDNLYFFDSLTSNRSVCRDVAKAAGIKYARRDVFLDNENDADYIEGQLTELEKTAFRRGRAIAVCHDRRTTIAVLARVMPRMAGEGIKFVPLSELVEK